MASVTPEASGIAGMAGIWRSAVSRAISEASASR
jgi:hypothetical protein